MYFLTAKSTKNSPADASAYFVPSNVRNGRLFAGLQANRPRFLPLLAGTSFHGSASGRDRSPRNAAGGMRPGQAESTEAYDRPWKRVSTAALSLGAEEEQPTARVPGAGGCKGLILLRPLNAGRRLFPRKATCGWFWYFCHQKYRESRDDVAGVLYLFSAKRYPKTPRQMPAHPTCRLNAGFGRPPKRRVLGGCANIHKTGVLRLRF